MKLFKNLTIGFILLFSAFTSFGQACMMVPVPLEERVTKSDLVIEGKIVGQKAFYSHDKSAIYTVNKIEVYKVFKGTLASNIISVVTEGGVVGNEMHKVSPSLGLIPGEVGVITLEMSGVTLDSYNPNFLNNGTTTPSNEMLYLPHASAQGYINYDKHAKKAIGVFDKYDDVLNDLYIAIHNVTGRGYVEIKSFNAVDYINDVQNGARATVTISSLVNSITGTNIVSAGCYQEITITGSGFGTNVGQVLFGNASDGGATTITCPTSLITVWNDAQIRLYVPNDATTGPVTVKNATSGSASKSIIVPYNVSNLTSSNKEHTADMINKNAKGGYTWTYNTNFYTNKDAVARFAEALCKWTGATEVNWDTAATRSTVSCQSSTDAVNICTFDNNCALPNGVLGTCYSYYGGCGSPTSWYVSGLDIKFDASQNWYYGFGENKPGDGISTGPLFSQYDFMSVAMHEVGHGHQLGHFALTSDIMYWSLTNGDLNRTIDANAANGGLFVMDRNVAAPTATTTAAVTAESNYIGHTGGSFVANSCNPTQMTPRTCIAGPSCFDGIQNQGEAGIDCGAPCAACPTCTDGIQNGTEVGVDCGPDCGGGAGGTKPPTNDDICLAKDISGGCANGESNSCASSSGLSLGCVIGDNMLWYQYQMPPAQDGIDVTISNSSSGGNFEIMIIGHKCTSLSVYGTDCGVEGTYSFTGLPEDSLYFIGIATTAVDKGTFDICVASTGSPCVGGAPSNDEICSASVFNGGTSSNPTAFLVSGSLCLAGQTDSCATSDYNDGGCISAGAMSVWYSFKLTSPDNKVDISFNSNTFLGGQVGLMLLDSICSSPNFVWSDCGNASLETFSITSLKPDSVYWLMVSTPQGSQGDFEICIQASSDPCVFAPASNDSICNAANVPFDGTGVACYNSQTNDCSFPDYSTGCIGANSNTVWYEFDLDSNNTDIKINFANTTFANDTVQVGIIEGTACDPDSLTAWVYNNCLKASTDSIVIKGLDSTKKYFVMIATEPGNEGGFDMCIKQSLDPCAIPGARPANDTLCVAQTILTDSTCITGQSNVCASKAEIFGGCFNGDNSTVWYKFNLTPGSNKVTVAINNYTFSGDVNVMLYGVPKNTACANISGAGLIYGTSCKSPATDYVFTEIPDTLDYYLAIGTDVNEQGDFEICLKGGSIPPGSKRGPEQDCAAGIAVCGPTYSTNDAYIDFGSVEEVFNNCLGAGEKNSVWYIMTVQESGAFGFNIASTPAVDYDFALYDISLIGCAGVPNAIPVRCNYCQEKTPTGLDETAPIALLPETEEPAGGGCDPMSEGINAVAGETYALVVSNYTADNTGFTLNFTGASVYDTIPPQIWEAYPDCGTSSVILRTDEPVMCASISKNDYSVLNLDNGLLYTSSIINATGVGCDTVLGATTNEIILENDGSWPSGRYRICVKPGAILQDKCGNTILPGGCLDFEYVIKQLKISADKNVICTPGEKVTITATGLPPNEVYILNPGGIANTTGIFSVYPTTTTIYSVLTEYAGCVNQSSMRIKVIEDFTAQINPRFVTICSGNTSLIGSSIINGAECTNCSYSWSIPQNSLPKYKDTVSVGQGNWILTSVSPEGCISDPVTATVREAGGVQGAVCEVMYVAPVGVGLPSNDGLTKDAPTILDSALARSICTGTVIKCQVGDYNYDTCVYINSFITLEGGFLPGFITKTSNMSGTNGTRFIRSATTADDGSTDGLEYSMFKVVGGSESFRFQDLKILMPTTHPDGSKKNNYGINLGIGCTNYNIVRCLINGGNGANL